MQVCNRFGIKSIIECSNDVVEIDLGVARDDDYDEKVATIRLNRDDAEYLLCMLQMYLEY